MDFAIAAFSIIAIATVIMTCFLFFRLSREKPKTDFEYFDNRINALEKRIDSLYSFIARSYTQDNDP